MSDRIDPPFNLAPAVIAFAAIVSAIAIFARYHEIPFLQVNPYYFVADTSRSLWESGSLERKQNAEVYRLQLGKSQQDPGRAYWQDIFSLGRNGKLYPTRGVLMALAGAPFYGLFGDFGFWLMSQLQIFLVVHAVFRIVRRLASPQTALLQCCFMLVGTQLLRYSYQFSYDVFATALVLVGLDLARRRPFVGALVMTLAAETRINYALLVPCLLLAWPAPPRDRRRTVLALLSGVSAGAALVLGLNAYLWGDPLTTGYHRSLFFRGGAAFVQPVSSTLGLGIFLADWGHKLLAGEGGLLRHNPVLVILPFGLWLARKTSMIRTHAAIGAAIALQVGFVYSLAIWPDNNNANRYLLCAIALAAIPSSTVLEAWRVRRLRDPARVRVADFF